MSFSARMAWVAHRLALGLRMARPGFLAITAVGCLVGMASAQVAGGLDGARALLTLLLALMLHAAANMLNDHADALNGADAANTQGLFPFTGGSRLVQGGVVQARDMRNVALALLALAVPGGLWLTLQSGPALLVVGLAGMLLGWAYSMPPLALMSRGLGELAVGLAWGLMVVGADYVQRGQFAAAPALLGVGIALLVACVLLINGFPDAQADARVGKRSAVVWLGPTVASAVYLALVVGAHLWLIASVWLLLPPQQALWGLVSAPLSLAAGAWLWRHRHRPQRLKPALVLSVLAVLLHGLAMSAGFWQLALGR